MTTHHLSIRDRLRATSFFADLADKDIDAIAALTTYISLLPGEVVAEEGTPAESFFVIEEGKVSIEIHAAPWGVRPVGTLGPGDVFGWSWLFAPYVWHFDGRAITAGSALEIDGIKLRELLETNHALGYTLMKRFAQIMIERLKATRLQVLDMYR